MSCMISFLWQTPTLTNIYESNASVPKDQFFQGVLEAVFFVSAKMVNALKTKSYFENDGLPRERRVSTISVYSQLKLQPFRSSECKHSSNWHLQGFVVTDDVRIYVESLKCLTIQCWLGVEVCNTYEAYEKAN